MSTAPLAIGFAPEMVLKSVDGDVTIAYCPKTWIAYAADRGQGEPNSVCCRLNFNALLKQIGKVPPHCFDSQELDAWERAVRHALVVESGR